MSTRTRGAVGLLVAVAIAVALGDRRPAAQDAGLVELEAVPLPAPMADSPDRNIFYGPVPPLPAKAPVIVFVHGLNGTAADWFIGNDMYRAAYRNGFRAAYVSLNADNTRNNASLQDNGAVLRDLLPKIAAHFGVTKMYLVGHSKGGLDIQSALLDPRIAALTQAVFTISTPNQGTELADWAFEHPGVAEGLNLLTPGVASLRLENVKLFRAIADPILRRTGIPFYTFTGRTAAGNALTMVTGLILKDLSPQQENDGVVTVERSLLPPEYSASLGELPFNHFETDSGLAAFPKIHARIQGMENSLEEFERIAAAGFGNTHNTWAWSMAWFKGKLYVGTGSEVDCMSYLTADINTGSKLFTAFGLTGQCPDYSTFIRTLAAEIWEYTPETRQWKRVFRSPDVIPVLDIGGTVVNTARDIGFRGMTVFTEADGTEALYAGGVTSGGIFDYQPQYRVFSFPPPRLLRSTDGETWTAVPQTPGTVLGRVGEPLPGSTRKLRSFRALTPYKGKLFATISDYRGVGVVFASATPAAGNDTWYQASPKLEEMPVWNLHAFNGYLYATTGLKEISGEGYGVYKTTAEGTAPSSWIPIITNGGYQLNPRVRAPNGLSFMDFNGQLYLGTNRPTELIRINPDDTWDLIVGEPRLTPQGFKAPLSGFGVGFGNWFNGHFWRMANHGGQLYLGTWDWSHSVQVFPRADAVFGFQFGFDLYRTEDGIRWNVMTHTGYTDPRNYGVRSFASTPAGLFFGTANKDALDVFHRPDVQPEPALASPQQLESVSQFIVGQNVVLSWQPVPGAARYRIYRSTVHPITEFFSSPLAVTIPGTTETLTLTLDDIEAGKFDYLCEGLLAETPLCTSLQQVKLSIAAADSFGLMTAFQLVGLSTNTQFFEPAPTPLQSIYFVRAEDADGDLSKPSNIVGGPSKAPIGGLRTIAPIVAPAISPALNVSGWSSAAQVGVNWIVATPRAGLKASSGCEPVVITAEGETPVTCEATNSSGQTTTRTVVVRLDRTPPEISDTQTPAPNQYGWNNTPVQVDFACSDATSGIANCGETPQIVTAMGAGQSRVGTAVDLAGNVATAVAGPINIDLAPPTIAPIVSPPANEYGWHKSDVRVAFSAADVGSGVLAVTPPVTLTAEGAGQIVSGVAADYAGNTTPASVTINIDKTPPEAFVRFDPVKRDVVVDGVDGLAGVVSEALVPAEVTRLFIADHDDLEDGAGAGGPHNHERERRTYVVTDRAGNALTLTLLVRREGHQARARVVSLVYNDGEPVAPGPNVFKFEWSAASDGTIRSLEQNAVIGSGSARQHMTANFDGKRNETVVKTLGRDREEKIARPGLFLLQLATSAGALALPSN